MTQWGPSWRQPVMNVIHWPRRKLMGLVQQCRELSLEPHAGRNLGLYLAAFGILSLTSSFGGAGSSILTNLMLKCKAPTWMASMPAIAGTSIAYLPVVLMGWLLRPGRPKKRVYAVMATLFYTPSLVMGLALLVGGSDKFLRVVLLFAQLSATLCVGLLVLPFWDLFHRSFPVSRRGRVTGLQGSIGSLCGLLAGPMAGWLISDSSPLVFPMNYVVGLLVAFAGGTASVVLLVLMKDVSGEIDPPGPHRSFTGFVGDLVAIVRTDHGFRRFLTAAVVAGMLAPAGTLMLVYAKTHRGFTDNHVGVSVAITPYVAMPTALLFGWLLDRIGAKRMCLFCSPLLAVGVALAPFLWGIWQIVPMSIAGYGIVYSYVILAIINHAPPGRSQDYMSVYYLTAMIPGLAPVVLGWLVDTRPVLVLAILAALALVSAILFMKSSSSAWQKKPAPSQTADQPGAAEPAGAPAGHLSGAADAASKSD